MPTPTPSWTTSDGKNHTDYLKSLKHEAFLWLSKAGENEVGARRIVDSLTEETITPFLDILEKIEEEIADPSRFKVVSANVDKPPMPVAESVPPPILRVVN